MSFFLTTGIQLWGIVNNAGICYIGNVEMMTEADMQKIMAVNYMGPVHVCKSFLPLLRRSHGRLVNVASNAGTYQASAIVSINFSIFRKNTVCAQVL